MMIGYSVYAWAKGKSAYYNSKEVRVTLLHPSTPRMGLYVFYHRRDTTPWLATKPRMEHKETAALTFIRHFQRIGTGNVASVEE